MAVQDSERAQDVTSACGNEEGWCACEEWESPDVIGCGTERETACSPGATALRREDRGAGEWPHGSAGGGRAVGQRSGAYQGKRRAMPTVPR